MNRKQNLEVFAKTPVRKAVLLQIVPAVASQMVTLVYNLADTDFVGMLNAPQETAAVTVAYPSFLMLTAISNLFGVGGASAIARALGRQDEEGARRIAAVSLAGGLLSALLFSAVFRLLADPVLHLCGATEATYATAYGYAKWVVILGGPFTILNTLLANLVRAEGSAGAAAFGVSFGGVLNILLDPLFVLPQFLGLGAVGAGMATALSNGAAVACFAAQMDPTLNELEDIKTAVSEAVTNAIVHAYPDTIGRVVVKGRICRDNVLEITVKDRGRGIPDVEQARRPMFTTGGEERSGMGFTIMESFMDRLTVRSVPGRGTTVVLRKRLAPRVKAGR